MHGCCRCWRRWLLVGAAPRDKLTGGNGTLYIGGWPNKIFIIDEATEKVTGAIDVDDRRAERAHLVEGQEALLSR